MNEMKNTNTFRSIALLMLGGLLTGCFTTQGFLSAAARKDADAQHHIAVIIPAEGNCMIVQLRRALSPVKLVMRRGVGKALERQEADDILRRFPQCDEVAVFDGFALHSSGSLPPLLYPEDYVVLATSTSIATLDKEIDLHNKASQVTSQ